MFLLYFHNLCSHLHVLKKLFSAVLACVAGVIGEEEGEGGRREKISLIFVASLAPLPLPRLRRPRRLQQYRCVFDVGKTRDAIPFVFSYFMRTFERAENDISMKLFPWVSSRGLYWGNKIFKLRGCCRHRWNFIAEIFAI